MTAEERCVVAAVLALARAGGFDEMVVAEIDRDLAAYIAMAEAAA